jgi:hypothetical protein
MEARADLLHRLREHVPHLHLAHRREPSVRRLTGIGVASGIVGGLAFWVPLLVYDWAKASHSALELPMAVSGWLFGLNYFGQNAYHWGPIVIGALFALAYWSLSGLAFAAVAERVYRVRTGAGAAALGAAWSFVGFMFFWYMLLPIARDGAPFRPTAAGEFVAPAWTWILGFAVSGLLAGAAYLALQRRAATRPASAATAPQQQAA